MIEYMGYEIKPAEVDYAQFTDVVLVSLPCGEEVPCHTVEDAKQFIRRRVELLSLNSALDAIFSPALFGRPEGTP